MQLPLLMLQIATILLPLSPDPTNHINHNRRSSPSSSSSSSLGPHWSHYNPVTPKQVPDDKKHIPTKHCPTRRKERPLHCPLHPPHHISRPRPHNFAQPFLHIYSLENILPSLHPYPLLPLQILQHLRKRRRETMAFTKGGEEGGRGGREGGRNPWQASGRGARGHGEATHWGGREGEPGEGEGVYVKNTHEISG